MSDDGTQLEGQPPTAGPQGEVAVAEPAAAEEERADDHLADVEEGAGCTEIWEHLSERREE